MSLLAELAAICGPGGVLTEQRDLEPYLTDWRGVFHGAALAVVRPADTTAVAACVRAARAAGAAIVPQGGNTGLAAGATPLDLDRAVVLSLSRMRNVRWLDALGFTIALDAGCVLADVQGAADSAGRFFPLSLAAEGSAQIGGLIATNAGGTAVLRYGSMRALVLGLEVVLADGRIADGMRALRKDNAGYDWKQLFIGSEGTLGVITGAVLRLFARPAHRATALLGIDSPENAVAAFAEVQEALGEALVGCELFSELAVGLRLAYAPELVRPLAPHPWYLLVEAASSLPGLREGAEQALALVTERGYASAGVMAESSAQALALWEWRESIAENERRTGPSAKHDVSVAVSAIPSFLARAHDAVGRNHPEARVLAFGHVGDGNIHFNVLLGPGDCAEAVNHTVHSVVRDFDGSITAEHGVGRYRREELALQRGPVEMELMRAVKRAIDPADAMNPGAVLASD
ncbi:MAG TPA: FAD-binding oxidoreductase [Candidatus Baltobacteraceae bacterium]|nr:FAD-binding oxidoreductase [Candidatus Baltobacteraceae bacterium]